jgi:Zn-finger nucleic acid-binding protein
MDFNPVNNTTSCVLKTALPYFYRINFTEMKCPVCQTELLFIQRHGIETGSCPECNGTWIERSELEKILDHFRSLPELVKPEHRNEEHVHRTSNRNIKQRKKSFLDELFE